jgi:uncharacterized protein YndB with AHSA1/START domain
MPSTIKLHPFSGPPPSGPTRRFSMPTPWPKWSQAFGGKYLELKPNEPIRYTDKFDDPNLPGKMQTTITLKKVSVGQVPRRR